MLFNVWTLTSYLLVNIITLLAKMNNIINLIIVFTMTTRYMPYDKHDFRFIMSNLYHDVIHDYGPGSSDERWEKVQSQLKQFGQQFTITVGGARSKHQKEGSSRRLVDLSKYTAPKPPSIRNIMNPRTRRRISNIIHTQNIVNDYDMTYYLLQDFVNSVNTKICFNTFFATVYSLSPTTIPPTFSIIFDYMESEVAQAITGSKINKIDELYARVSYYTRLYYRNDLGQFIGRFLRPEPNNLFNILEKFILISIYDTVNREQSTASNKSKRVRVKFNGGAATDKLLDALQLGSLIAELEEERDDRIMVLIDAIYNSFIGRPTDYTTSRRFVLQRTKEILKKYGQLKKMGSVDNASSCINKCCFLPPVPRSSRQANKTLDEFTRDCFLDYYNNGLIEFYKGQLTVLKAEEEAVRLRAEREAIRTASGELTKDQRLIRDQFCSLIAKLGLVLNGEYTIDGQQNPIVPHQNDDMTAKEINLLANWSNWGWNPSLYTSNIRPSGVRSTIDVDLFDFTHKYFETYMMGVDEYPTCKTSPGLKYVIDNAAMVPSNLKDFVFCPVSSVVDGMKKCNVNQLEEWGDMDFIFCERSEYDALQNRQVPIQHYYRGLSNYTDGTKSTVYRIELKTPALTLPIILQKNIDLAGTALEAHNVLRETLVNVIGFIIYLQQTSKYEIISTLVYQNKDGIFGGLYECLFNTTYEEKYPGLDADLPALQFGFLTGILNILFKGSGDLFQEINAACKWGGYTGGGYGCSSSVIKYNASNTKSSNDGNTLRMFIANDQPSGCRFAFLLLKGYEEFINKYAFGGYMGIGKTLLVTRADIESNFRDRICAPNPNFAQSEFILHGGSNVTKEQKQNRKTRKIKKQK